MDILLLSGMQAGPTVDHIYVESCPFEHIHSLTLRTFFAWTSNAEGEFTACLCKYTLLTTLTAKELLST